MFSRRSKKGFAKVRTRHVRGKMNDTELAYKEQLDILKSTGQIDEYYFEKIKLLLAEGCTWTCDFMVVDCSGFIEFHEVKAATSKQKILAEDDAIVKIKTAAEMFPMFRFKIMARLPKKLGSMWISRKFNWPDEEINIDTRD